MIERVIDFVGLLGLAALIQATLLVFFVGLKKQNQLKAKLLLTLLLFIFAFTLLHDVLVRSRYMLDYPHFFATGMAFVLAIGPLMYLYVRWLTSDSPRFFWWDLLHFIPLVLGHLDRMDTYTMSAAAKVARLEQIFSRVDQVTHIPMRPWQDNLQHFMIWHFQTLIYLVLALGLLSKHARLIKTKYAYTEKINFRWMQQVLYGYVVIYLLEYGFEISSQISGVNLLSSSGSGISIILLSLQIYLLTYVGLQNPSALPVSEVVSVPQPLPSQVLNAQQVSALSNRLEAYMNDTKIYQNPKLSLQMLSEALEVSTRYISFAINQGQDKNFFDFVNDYRIEEAKKLLLGNKTSQWTVAAVSKEAGFNSRDAFYRAFKKNCGMTPTQYRKAHTIG